MSKDAVIAVVGRACRLPGADSIEAFWRMLRDGTCSVSRIPQDRWSLDRLYHPRQGEKGRSYTWAAGVLDDIWAFEPGAFGLSPREADQMDPQQRLLLELTYEAFEDAGLKPSQRAGSDTAVYVGASSTEHGNLRVLDPASSDAYTATGNALSIASNRISYVFDLRGPSLTVDTACSSSLVALNEAVGALRSGRIDTAVVAGVNVLASPSAFVSFSQAGMLSRRGLCQAFGAGADGYVRSEGAVVFVLTTLEAARRTGARIHGLIVDTDVNSDGRTSGIALPARRAQTKLLQELYARAGVQPDEIAFVEAHGTGTPVGDPIEAGAIGDALARHRMAPLPIGSAKSNIGHTEPAAGLIGMLKAMLALEHDRLPATLHTAELNPAIAFDALNLMVCQEGLDLPSGEGRRFAGVNSFGFGGTNAHVILADAPRSAAIEAGGGADTLLLSATNRTALGRLAASYADRFAQETPDGVRRIAAAAYHRKDRLSERLVVPLDDVAAATEALATVGQGGESTLAVLGTALTAADSPVAFVYSGNGSQWVGMGRRAYATGSAFRARFDAVDRIYRGAHGWSPLDALHAKDLADSLPLTSVAQPLIFALQVASTYALAERGLVPDMVLGHSVGEVAAAEAAGILDLPAAVEVIHHRSGNQERTRSEGAMAVVTATPEQLETFATAYPDIDIAAYNSPRAFTLAGPTSAIDEVVAAHKGTPFHARRLDLDYPFHSRLMAPIETPLLRDLAGLSPRAGARPMISTVTGSVLSGQAFDAAYWWRNIREPVRFRQAVEAAARDGARIVLEIGPRSTLLRYIDDCFGETRRTVFGVHSREPGQSDPIVRAAAQALAAGATFEAASFGDDPGPGIPLPTMPWERTQHRLDRSTEATAITDPRPLHPLLGARPAEDALVWTAVLDTALLPGYADHRVGGQPLLPGSGFLEMALAAAADWLPEDRPALRGFEILAPMVLSDTAPRDVRVQITPSTRVVEVSSRRRLASTAWHVHARAKIVEGAPTDARTMDTALGDKGTRLTAEALYTMARSAGLDYGPSFRRVIASTRRGQNGIAVELDGAAADPAYLLDPMRLDACFHGLVQVFAELEHGEPARPYIPVRFEEVRLLKRGATAAVAEIRLRRMSTRGIRADLTVLDAVGGVICEILGARFQPMRLRRADEFARHAILQRLQPAAAPTVAWDRATSNPREAILAAVENTQPPNGELSPTALLLEGWATTHGFALAATLAEDDVVAPLSLLASSRINGTQAGWLGHLLDRLEASGLAQRLNDTWRLFDGDALPRADDVLAEIADTHPELAVELPLAASLSARTGNVSSPPSWSIDALELRGHFVREAASRVATIVAGALDRLPAGSVLRILQLASGPLTRALAPLCLARRIALTVLEPDLLRFERARLGLPSGAVCTESLGDASDARFDLVVAADALHRMDRGLIRNAIARLDGGGLLLAIEPEASLFRDLVLGQGQGWFHPSADPLLPAGGIPDDDGWRDILSGIGLHVEQPRPLSLTGGGARLLLATAPETASRKSDEPAVAIFHDDRAAAAANLLADRLRQRGVGAILVGEGGPSGASFGPAVFMSGAFDSGGDAGERIAVRCLALRACAAGLSGGHAPLWVVCPGGLRPEGGAIAPVQSAIWGFARVFANERSDLDVRRVDVPEAFGQAAADRLCDVVLGGTDETEIAIDDDRTRVLRIGGFDLERARGEPAQAAVLEQETPGVLDGLRWVPVRRTPPGPKEVEIAVEATGLNFRDVLFALSMLPDDILEDGFSGPGMGLECAGRVLRVGSAVSHVKVGDAVMAFAHSGFGTHVTVPSALVAPIPDGVTPEAAATIPVAFMTAYHGLVTQAGLRRRETVLIHGAAGGVGLAAIQIARQRGARVFATAGSAERRALALALGADMAFDSRSLAFVDGVRAATPDGVDVVLNSLAGEAMEESLGLLKPFGRFVELGKRDYVADTHIGLRPFRRNLSYFGVDLDQLLLGQPAVGRKLLRDVLGLFRRGALVPLPYERFAAVEVSNAFRLLQASGHVGKVVVTPPVAGEIVQQRDRPFRPDPSKTWVISGGFGGFGAEAARWLVERGVRHLLLLGRQGAASENAQRLVADLVAQGASVSTPACNVADHASLAAALATPGMQSVGGVIHAAMVLDDGLISGLDEAQLHRVLAPKVTGADLLDALTRAMPVDHFVLFSSATTIIGNPGQGAYVAANAYLEAVARRRRASGLPALAIAWGAIEDVGVLAKQPGMKDRLAARTGIDALKARDALELMAEALQHQGSSPEDAVIGLASVNLSVGRNALPILRSPSYAPLIGQTADDAATSHTIDLEVLASSIDREASRNVVADTIADEVARILRMPRADVSRERALSELGLDSLMGVELAMALQTRFSLGAPPADLDSSQSINGVADLLLGTAAVAEAAPDPVAALARRHLDADAVPEAASTIVEHTDLPLASA